MPRPRSVPRALVAAVAAVAGVVGVLLVVGVGASDGRSGYDVVKDLLVPLVGPVVAVLIPVLLFFVIPLGQSRQRVALDLCAQYYGEEMRDARNVGWRHFVTEQRQLPPDDRAARLAHFLDYLTEPEVHRGVSPEVDAVYQKTTRVLDYFAIVDGCLARGVADADVVREFLLYYYVWWRDEIIDPLRRSRRIDTRDPKFRPVWWNPLPRLDALAAARR